MADSTTRLFGMLGFAMRAGRLTLGSEQVFAEMAKPAGKRPEIVVYARDASDGAKKKIRTKSEFYGIEAFELPITAAELGQRLGKTYTPVLVGVNDAGFAKEIRLSLSENTSGKEVSDPSDTR